MEFFNEILEAAIFAAEAHKGQVRKYTGEPYIVHPISVANLVHSVGGNSRQIIAALLHDTVEDTAVTLEEIDQHFGEHVAELVDWLTDVSKPSDGNRAKRKEIDRHHIAGAPVEAKTVKLADLIDNSHSIVRHDPKFAKVFVAEKKLLLPVLVEGNQRLWTLANEIITHWEKGETK